MRKYTLASSNARSDVDLRDYSDIITEAVNKIMPRATVLVEKTCYYVSPTPRPGDAVRIGRQICRSELSKYCVSINKLFSGTQEKPKKVEEHDDNKPTDRKQDGGHF